MRLGTCQVLSSNVGWRYTSRWYTSLHFPSSFSFCLSCTLGTCHKIPCGIDNFSRAAVASDVTMDTYDSSPGEVEA